MAGGSEYIAMDFLVHKSVALEIPKRSDGCVEIEVAVS